MTTNESGMAIGLGLVLASLFTGITANNVTKEVLDFKQRTRLGARSDLDRSRLRFAIEVARTNERLAVCILASDYHSIVGCARSKSYYPVYDGRLEAEDKEGITR